MKSLLMMITALTFAHSAIAMHHENTSRDEDGFTTLMVKADDPSAYIDLLKSDDSAFKATGTVAAGYCLT